jgi:hypothetical protein
MKLFISTDLIKKLEPIFNFFLRKSLMEIYSDTHLEHVRGSDFESRLQTKKFVVKVINSSFMVQTTKNLKPSPRRLLPLSNPPHRLLGPHPSSPSAASPLAARGVGAPLPLLVACRST